MTAPGDIARSYRTRRHWRLAAPTEPGSAPITTTIRYVADTPAAQWIMGKVVEGDDTGHYPSTWVLTRDDDCPGIKPGLDAITTLEALGLITNIGHAKRSLWHATPAGRYVHAQTVGRAAS